MSTPPKATKAELISPGDEAVAVKGLCAMALLSIAISLLFIQIRLAEIVEALQR